MKYFYFLLAGLLGLVAIYSLFGIYYFKWQYHQVENPKASFQIINNETNEITLVDFTNYSCGYCKGMHKTIKEALNLNKKIRYIPRPILIPIDSESLTKQEPVELEKLVLAAGMQGKFKEMHDAFMEYPNAIIPVDFIKETATLYGVNYDKMVADAQSKKVQDYLNDNIHDLMNAGVDTIPTYIIGRNFYVVKDKMPDLKQFLSIITNEEEK